MILTIPTCIDDHGLCEKLIDFLYHLNSRQPQGHALLAVSQGVPQDARERIKISATLAFDSFEELEMRPLIDSGAPKFIQINNVFRQVAQFVHEHYKSPWLFMEPDCTPVKPGWWKALSDAYDAQPRRYMGNFMQVKDLMFVARASIYPAEAIMELQPFLTTLPGESDKAGPFERRAASVMVGRTTKTRLIHQLQVTEETIGSVWPEAVLVHGDKSGLLRQSVKIPELPDSIADGVSRVPHTRKHESETKLWDRIEKINGGLPHEEISKALDNARPHGIDTLAIPKKRGRPPKIKAVTP